MKKTLLGILIGILFVFSVSAQNNTDSFVGNWKPIKHSFKTKVPNSIMTLNIVQNGDDVKVERMFKNNDTKAEWSDTSLFKVNRTLIGNPEGRFGQIGKTEIRFLNPKKIRISTTLENIYNYRSENRQNDYIQETWLLSDDGKFLTIERNYNGYFSDTVYAKI